MKKPKIDIPCLTEVRKFSDNRHGLLEADLACGRLTMEIHLIPSTLQAVLIARLKTGSTSKISRKVMTKMPVTKDNYDAAVQNLIPVLWPNKMLHDYVEVIESRVEDDALIDFKKFANRPFLRIINKENMQWSIFPLRIFKREDAENAEDIENLLEVFKGKYDYTLVSIPSHGVNCSIVPENPFGLIMNNCNFDYRRENDQINERTRSNLYGKEGFSNTAMVSRYGETVALHQDSKEIRFYGCTDKNRKIIMSFPYSEDNFPDFNISKFPVVKKILSTFDVTKELSILNNTRKTMTITEELFTPEIEKLFSYLLEITLAKK